MIDYSKFQKALANLDAQYNNWLELPKRAALFPLDADAVAESVVQRFELCYDCLWKALKRYMAEVLGLPDLPNSPKPLFRIAAENGLLRDTDKWLHYADLRCATTHDYSEKKAQQAVEACGGFIADAAALYALLTGDAPYAAG